MGDFTRSRDMIPSAASYAASRARPWGLALLAIVGLAPLVYALVDVFSSKVTLHHRGGKLSNIRRVLLASIIYGADYDDRLPHRDRWMDAVEPFLEEKSRLHRSEIKDATGDVYGYAFLSHLSLFSFVNVKEPARLPVLYDSVNLARNASDPFTSLPAVAENVSRNLGFCDGHAKHVGREGEADALVVIQQQFEGGS